MGNKIIPISVRLEKSKSWKFNFISEKKNYPLYFFLSFKIEKYIKKVLERKKLNFINIYIKNNGSKIIYIYIYYKLPTLMLFNKLKINYNKKNIKIKNKKIKIEKYKKILKFVILRKLKIFVFLKYLEKKFENLYKNNFKVNLILSPIIFCNCIKSKNLFLYNLNYRKNLKIFNFLNLAIILKNPELITKIIYKLLIKQKYHRKFFLFIFKDLKKICDFNKNFFGFRIQLKGKLNGKMRSKKLFNKYGKNSLNCLNFPIYYSYLPMKTRYGIFGIKVWLIYKNVKK